MLEKLSYIRHKSDGWHVYSEEGKNLGGPYTTEGEAKKRLAQIHYFKYIKTANKKILEFAPGIPDKKSIISIPNVTSTQTWEYVLQHHLADKAGAHYDFRIGPQGGPGFSWVLKNGLPTNGEKVLAIRQPDHNIKYFEFEGTIHSGYGKGDVKIADKGQVVLLKANDDKITFYIPKGNQAEKYTMIHTNGNDWLMLNHTMPESIKKEINVGKLKYKDMTKNYVPQVGDFSVPKIDGAFSITLLRPNKTPLVYGYRESKKTGHTIEYTPKIKSILNSVSPKDVGNTVLRTEVYAVDTSGNELSNRLLGGILNSSAIKSLKEQKDKSTPLQLAAFDILKYKGRDVSKKTPIEKLELIRRVANSYPLIQHPIDLAKKYNFPEGKIIWRNGIPIKVKNKNEHDVYVRNIFPAELTGSKIPRAGGFEYSHTPDGEIVGNVGTGIDHKELIDMLNNPQTYIGRVARVYSQEKFPSGALRAPSFNAWHIEKNIN